MKYDFDTLVDRANTGNMKDCLTPAEFSGSGRIAFAGAEMDFKTAPVIIRALQEFAAKGIYGFTLADDAYIRAVRWWMENARDFTVAADEIIPTLGTIFSVGTSIRAFTQPGDGVMLLHPVYYRYDVRIRENGRRVVSVPLREEHGVYSLDADALEEQMAQPRNKLLVLCNPHNPIGKVFTGQELETIRDLARQYQVIVFSDEIFAELTFNGHTAPPFAQLAPGHAITCTSLGKVFNLTGVNHANIIIRDDTLRRAFIKQRTADHFGSVDPFFYSTVLAGYSSEGLQWMEAMKTYVWENYRWMRSYLEQNLPDIQMSPLEGGFVVWVDFRSLRLGDAELTDFLEQEAQMIVDLGADYGTQGEGFRRMNIASPRRYLEDCMQRLSHACAKRRQQQKKGL